MRAEQSNQVHETKEMSPSSSRIPILHLSQGDAQGWMGVATEPRHITELQQIFLQRDLDPGAAGWELEGHFGVGTGWLSQPGDKELFMGRLQRLPWVPVPLTEMLPSRAGFVPRLRKPPRLPGLLSRLSPAAGRCSPGSPCLPQLSSWPWLPGLAGHAPVPLALAKPVLASRPVPRRFAGSVTGSARHRAVPEVQPPRSLAGWGRAHAVSKCRSLLTAGAGGGFSERCSVFLAAELGGSRPGAWQRPEQGTGQRLLASRNPPASCSTGRAPASPS